MGEARLPAGVKVRRLELHRDARGELAELYRADWTPSPPFRQWNFVRSREGVLRGVHVHPRHCDYLHVVEGELLLGLHDLRPEDRARRTSAFLTITGEAPTTVYIPAGVCHGFYFPRPTVYVYGLSTVWSLAEEFGCRFDDPALGLEWPVESPELSPRDREPGTDYASMRRDWQAAFEAAPQ